MSGPFLTYAQSSRVQMVVRLRDSICAVVGWKSRASGGPLAGFEV
jgi:hypothetical protein